MSNHFFKKLAKEKEKRDSLKEADLYRAEAIYNDLFPHQQMVVDDPFRFKAVLTPRRAGKTHTVGAYAFIEALRNPGSIIPIVTLTLKSAKRLYWNNIILNFSDKYGLNLRRKGGLHHTNLECTLENGSKIFLVGAETRAEIEKLRGGAYNLVPVDECKSFNPYVFKELVDEVLTPAINDKNGTLLIIGTPGSILSGPFYEATFTGYRDKDGDPVSRDYYNPQEHWDSDEVAPQWSYHHWTTKENIKAPQAWENALLRKKQKKWKDDNPIWVREYLGQWVATEDAMVYSYSSILEQEKENCRVHYQELPEDEWRYIMGIDLGFEDDFAIVVAAYSETQDTLYVVYDYKSPHLTISEAASKIQDVVNMFDDKIEAMVADTGGLGKMVVETLNKQYGFMFEAAEKKEKADFIELLNTDLWDGKIKIKSDSNLAQEWLIMQWDLGDKKKKELIRSNRLKVSRQCPDHVSDAFLYTWRYSLHHFSRQKEEKVVPNTPRYWNDWDKEEARKASERILAQENKNEWTDSVEEEWMDDFSWIY